jgi:dTMP kinase
MTQTYATQPLKIYPKQKRFITFEGGEGAGKSTQVKRLVGHLQTNGHDVIATREPGGSPHAEELRRLLLEGLIAPYGPEAEALIFSAARIDHIDHLIKPAIERGAFVICDRFADSTRAYQGASGTIDPSFIRALENITIGAIRPALTFILDVPAEIGLQRAAIRRSDQNVDRFESENIQFHKELQKAFHALAQEEPERCIVLDGTLSADQLEELIWKTVQERCLTHGADS